MFLGINFLELLFPTLEVIHIIGLAAAIGTIALIDFRLLNMGLKNRPVAELANDVTWWTIGGLIAVAISGGWMYSGDPDMYYLNSAFQIKMGLLLLALMFHYTTVRKVALQGGTAGNAKLVACLSLLLWSGVIACGIFIGFVGDAIPA